MHPPVVDLPAQVPAQPAEVVPNQAPVVYFEPIRDQLAPVPVESPKAERQPDPPVARTLRDRGTLRARAKYADEFLVWDQRNRIDFPLPFYRFERYD